MRTRLALLAISMLATDAVAENRPYGWTISASSSDPFENSATATFDVRTCYLWLACCDVPEHADGTPRAQGMTRAEFGLDASGITLLSLQPTFPCEISPNGPAVFCPQCPCGPFVVATLLLLDLPGSIRFRPSSNGVLATSDCEASPQLWGMDWIGFDNTGGSPEADGTPCEKPVLVSPRSWGRVKGMYR